MKKHPTTQSKARQLNLFVDNRSLFEKLCDLHNLQAGFKAVKKNGGGPGVDGVTIEEYADGEGTDPPRHPSVFGADDATNKRMVYGMVGLLPDDPIPVTVRGHRGACQKKTPRPNYRPAEETSSSVPEAYQARNLPETSWPNSILE